MADLSQLKADFNEGGAHEIFTNGTQDITGQRLNYVLNNIVDTINSEKADNAFIADPSETTYLQVKAAHESGRQVLCQLDNMLLPLQSITATAAVFSAFDGEAGLVYQEVVGSDNVWQEDTYEYASQGALEAQAVTISQNTLTIGGVATDIKTPEGYEYMGIAHPSDASVTPYRKVWYLATEAGTYTYKGGFVVEEGEVVILKYDSSWSKESLGLVQENTIMSEDELTLTLLNGYYIGDKSFVPDASFRATKIDVSEYIGKTLKAKFNCPTGFTQKSFFTDADGDIVQFISTLVDDPNTHSYKVLDNYKWLYICSYAYSGLRIWLDYIDPARGKDLESLRAKTDELAYSVNGNYDLSNMILGFYKSNPPEGQEHSSFTRIRLDVFPDKMGKLVISSANRGDAYTTLTDENNVVLWQSNTNLNAFNLSLSSYPDARYLYLSNETSVMTPEVYHGNEIDDALSLTSINPVQNKVITEEISSLRQSVGRNVSKILHISFDDTILSFKDLTDHANTYESIFDCPFFASLKTLHDAYGAVFSGYCFYNYYVDNTLVFSLANCTTKFASEFAANADWLRFGFHSIDNNTNYDGASAETALADYNTTITRLIAILGGVKSLDLCPRLQNFAGSLAACQAMRDAECGIIGLLCWDYDETGATPTYQKSGGYYLTDPKPSWVMKKGRWFDDANQLYFFRSNLRIDSTTGANMPTYLAQFLTKARYGGSHIMEMFGHENQMFPNGIVVADYNVRLTAICQWARVNGYAFGYLMDKRHLDY